MPRGPIGWQRTSPHDVRGRMAFGLAAALIALASAGAARADQSAGIAQALRTNSVYASPGALRSAAVKRLEREIARRDPGRVKVAVASASQTHAAGGVQALANALDQRLGAPGTVLVDSPSGLWLVTSYANTGAATNAVQRGFGATGPLVDQLVRSVDGIAKVDPGRGTHRARAPGTTSAATTSTAPQTPQGSTAPRGSTAPTSAPPASSSNSSLWPMVIVVLVIALAGLAVGAWLRRRIRTNGQGPSITGLGNAPVTFTGPTAPPPAVEAAMRRLAPALATVARRTPAGFFAPAGRRPWYARGSFWTGRFLIGLGIALAILVAYSWSVFGGLPRGFDRYGRVPVPGREVIALPAGAVTLDFENNLFNAGTDHTSVLPAPSGLTIRVTRLTDGAAPLAIHRIPGWLFESDGDTRGHKPYARVQTPAASRYLVETGDDRDPLAARPDASGQPTPPSGAPAITVGEKPWTPLGSVLFGAVLAGLLVGALFALPHLIVRAISTRSAPGGGSTPPEGGWTAPGSGLS